MSDAPNRNQAAAEADSSRRRSSGTGTPISREVRQPRTEAPFLDPATLQRVHSSFASLDTNGDGRLSLDEFAVGLGLIGMDRQFSAIIFNAFRPVDGMIDRREFVTTLCVMLHPEDIDRQASGEDGSPRALPCALLLPIPSAHAHP
jgi:hypothetical protein